MGGVKGLRRINYGQESTGTPGTKVPCTGQLRMNGMIQDDREVIFPEEQVGILGGTDRAYVAKLMASLEVEGEATFEQFPIVLGASIADTTGAADGIGTDFIYAHPFPAGTKNTIFTYTIETGDNQAAENMVYGYVPEWTLSGKFGESWMLSATWNGRSVTDSDAFTASTDAVLYNVEEMLFGNTKLYIDDDTGTIGTSLKSLTLLEAELAYTSGWIPKYTAEGQLYFSFIEQIGDECVLNITFEHDATSTAEKTKWRTLGGRAVRLLITGSGIATPGTTYSVKTCIIDLYGKWEKFEKIDEIDGNDVLKGTLRCKYSSAAAAKGSITVVNERVNH